MRWTRAALLTRARACGRRSRVVLTPRRWCQVDGGNSVDDGDKQARSPRRARRKPLKPLRGECRAFSGVTVVTNARVYYTPRAAAGASGARHSLRPLMAEGANSIASLARKQAARPRSYVLARRTILKCGLGPLPRARGLHPHST